jgi:hypothetical protein
VVPVLGLLLELLPLLEQLGVREGDPVDPLQGLHVRLPLPVCGGALGDEGYTFIVGVGEIIDSCVIMQAALIIALLIESHICDKSFFSYEILDKLNHLLMSLMIITKVGRD